MTYLEIVNATLRRLRRQEVMSVSASSYSQLIGDMVNLAKREVEDSWNWLALINDYTVFAVQGIAIYTLPDFGNRFEIQDVHNTDPYTVLKPITHRLYRQYSDNPDATTGPPTHWLINSFDTVVEVGSLDTGPEITFWPTPDSSSTNIRVYAKVPQVDLSADADVPLIPEYPIMLGAYARALDERGEDGGTTAQMAAADYRQALSDAISADNRNRAHGRESDWLVA